MKLLRMSAMARSASGLALLVAVMLPPQRINLGAVVRSVEPDFALVECQSDEARLRFKPRGRARAGVS